MLGLTRLKGPQGPVLRAAARPGWGDPRSACYRLRGPPIRRQDSPLAFWVGPHVLTTLGLRDRPQAVVVACESGLVTPGG